MACFIFDCKILNLSEPFDLDRAVTKV